MGEPPAPEFVLPPDETRALTARLAALDIAPNDFVIGINPGSTYGRAKRWLPERFAEVAQRMIRRIEEERGQRVAVLILGAKGEEALGRDVADRITGRSVVLSGRTTIRELMAATARCGLLLTNDTGPMHVAAAFRVPVVAVFGPTDWQTTSPYGQEHAMVREPVDCAPCLLRDCPIDHRCMTRLSVDRVHEATLRQLQHSPGVVSSSIPRDQSNLIDRAAETAQPDHIPMLSGCTVFLDRDGTLNPDPGYIRSPDQYELFPGVSEALAKLQQAGARLIVVTNQSGIARGLFSEADLHAVHDKLRSLLQAGGVSLDGIYVCPHHPDDGCHCRKPEPGMVEQAVRQHAIDLSCSYVIGDHARDMQLAKRIGAKAVLVTTGVDHAKVLLELSAAGLVPDSIATSLGEAGEWILSDARTGKEPRPVHHSVSS